MSAKYFYTPKGIKKKLLKLPLHVHRRLLNVFLIIKTNPVSGRKLHGELENYYKYRVGDYRIVYKFSPKESIVEIVKIEHRQGVYK